MKVSNSQLKYTYLHSMTLIWLLFYTNQLLHMFIMDIITYMYQVHIDSLNLKAQKHMLPVVAYIEF